MPASKSLSTSVRERTGEWGYDVCFTGRAPCLRTIRKGSTVTCPTSVLCLESRCRCSSSHSLSPSACISWGRQTAWSRPNRIICRYSGIRDHSLLKDFRCCGSILDNNIAKRLRRVFFRFRLLSHGGPAMEVVSLVFSSIVRVACCGDVKSSAVTSAFTRFTCLKPCGTDKQHFPGDLLHRSGKSIRLGRSCAITGSTCPFWNPASDDQGHPHVSRWFEGSRTVG